MFEVAVTVPPFITTVHPSVPAPPPIAAAPLSVVAMISPPLMVTLPSATPWSPVPMQEPPIVVSPVPEIDFKSNLPPLTVTVAVIVL